MQNFLGKFNKVKKNHTKWRVQYDATLFLLAIVTIIGATPVIPSCILSAFFESWTPATSLALGTKLANYLANVIESIISTLLSH